MALLATLVLGAPAVSAQAAGQTTAQPTDPAKQLNDNKSRRADLGNQVDALNATDDQLRGALDSLDDQLNAARDQLAAAEASVQASQALADAAAAAEASAAADVERSAIEVRAVAVDAYLNTPEAGFAVMMSATTVTDAMAAGSMLRFRARHRNDVLASQRTALESLTARHADADAAAADASTQRDALVAQVAALDADRSQRAQVVAEADRRLEAAMGESAALAAVDAKLASQVMAQKAALSAAVARPAPQIPVVKLPTPAPRPNAPGPSPTKPPATTPPTTTPPSGGDPPVIPTPVLRTVRGITVAASIADQLSALLGAASGAGLAMSGWGFRDPQQQIDLRRAHCGPTDYDIYERPANQCSPPTARPGLSMHERGLAVDFTCNGVTIPSHADPCFVWLAANAGGYGFINLPSEPWHWSTNGN